MLRAVLIVLAISLGAAALVFGLDIMRQLEEAMGVGSGLGGALRILVVAISPSTRSQVDFYRWQAELMIIAGAAFLCGGILLGCLSSRSGTLAGSKRNRRGTRDDGPGTKKR